MSLHSISNIQVRFHECDPLQIVWHGNYLKYFEVAREEFCTQHEISYLDVKKHGFSTPIVKSSCEHKLPLKYGDQFLVKTTFIPTLAAKMKFSYEVIMQEKIICTGETVQVFIKENNEMSLVNPPFFIDWKQKMGLI